MTEKEELLETGSDAERTSSDDEVRGDDAAQPVEPAEPREPMPPVVSRFMFVDIAAMRAKQLRRGAVPRIPRPAETEAGGSPSQKLERIAMAEIDEGLIVYQIPDPESETAASGEKAEP